MIMSAKRVLPGMMVALAPAARAAAQESAHLRGQDVGLLVLAFLVLVPLFIAVRIIPGWIESFHNLTREPDEDRPAERVEAEAEG